MATARKLSVGRGAGATWISILNGTPLWHRKSLTSTAELTDELDAAALVIWPESAVEFMVPEDLAALPPEVMPSFKSSQTLFYLRREEFSRHARPRRRQSL